MICIPFFHEKENLMAFLIYSIIFLVCLIIFFTFIIIGKGSWFSYFVVLSSMVGIMFSISEIFILVGKGLLP